MEDLPVCHAPQSNQRTSDRHVLARTCRGCCCCCFFCLPAACTHRVSEVAAMPQPECLTVAPPSVILEIDRQGRVREST